MSEAENVRRLFTVAAEKLPGFVASAMKPTLKTIGEEVAGVVHRLEKRIEKLEGGDGNATHDQ